MAGKKIVSRDDIRKAVLDSKPKSQIVNVFGQDIEIRQQRVQALFSSFGGDDTKNKARAFAELIIESCYVPGTDEKVFSAEDVDVLTQLPFGSDLMKLQAAINELMGLDIDLQRKNS